MTPPDDDDLSRTFAVELTPAGRAAVAVVVVDGPVALRAVEKLFVPLGGRSLCDAPTGRIVVGHWGGKGGEELVVARRNERQIEVHCHGGAAAVRRVIDSLVAEGCRELGWREWLRLKRDSTTLAPHHNASPHDGVTIAARIALANASTFRTAAILVDQMNGALTTAINQVIEAVRSSAWERASETTDVLLQRSDLGLHCATPWRVVLAGPPNVGKSSLINALAGFERAIVSPISGTTRDVVTFSTAIGGWPVEIADTAGLRSTTDELEAAGVHLAQVVLAAADLMVQVHDATHERALFGAEQPQLEPAPPVALRRVLQVFNKTDLLSVAAREKAFGENARFRDVVYTSATSGEGIAALVAAMERVIVLAPPPPGAAVPFTQEQVEALVVARQAIERRHAAAACDALQSLLST